MKLKAKLRQFVPQERKNERKTKAGGINLDPFLKGKEVKTPFGTCYLIKNSFPLETKQGFASLKNAFQVKNASFKKILPRQNIVFDLQNAIFLDTETTGLAGGTGTYAFLVGLGAFEGNAFTVTQYLMRDYNEEPAQLYLLNEEFAKADTIISFNGRRFDVPLLQTRFAMARAGFTNLQEQGQLDLLQPARRLWRHKLASCSLNSLERNLLGIKRVGDIAGFEIPQRYFEYLKTGRPHLLQVIVEHNVIDIISMVTLLYRIHLAGRQEPHTCFCPWEAEALAQAALEMDNSGLALAFLNQALLKCTNSAQKERLLKETALLHKREQRYDAAVSLWYELLEVAPHELSTYEELAKYYEHRVKDFKEAKRLTNTALALGLQTRSKNVPALEHRLARLEKKLARETKLA